VNKMITKVAGVLAVHDEDDRVSIILTKCENGYGIPKHNLEKHQWSLVFSALKVLQKSTLGTLKITSETKFDSLVCGDLYVLFVHISDTTYESMCLSMIRNWVRNDLRSLKSSDSFDDTIKRYYLVPETKFLSSVDENPCFVIDPKSLELIKNIEKEFFYKKTQNVKMSGL
jgi:hypothetical protein